MHPDLVLSAQTQSCRDENTLEDWRLVALILIPQKPALFCWDRLERFWQQSGCGGRASQERCWVAEWQKFCLGTEDKNPASQCLPHTSTLAFHPRTTTFVGWGDTLCPSGAAWHSQGLQDRATHVQLLWSKHGALGPWIYAPIFLHYLYKGQRCTSTNIRLSLKPLAVQRYPHYQSLVAL